MHKTLSENGGETVISKNCFRNQKKNNRIGATQASDHPSIFSYDTKAAGDVDGLAFKPYTLAPS